MTNKTVLMAAEEVTQRPLSSVPNRLSAALAVATHEVTYPRNGTGRRFSAKQILNWIDNFKTVEGRPPRWSDRKVWTFDQQNKPIPIRKVTWRVIDQYIQDGWLYCDGVHARSLHHLLDTKGFFAENKLSPHKLQNWISLFHEKEGRYPHHGDKHVWERKENGVWNVVQRESWDAINQSLRHGGRGLDVVPECSLAEFKKAHGFTKRKTQQFEPVPRTEVGMTTGKILGWMELFREKEGKYPSHIDKTIWERDATGTWVVVQGKSWGAVNMWLRKGHADGSATGIRSLAELKRQRGVPSKRGRQSRIPGTALPLLEK